MALRKCVLAGVLVLTMVMSTALVSLPASGGSVRYDYYIKGDPTDVSPETEGGLLLAGGSTDVAAAMEWMIDKAGAESGGGDFVIIRCSGDDAYNPWIYKQLGGVNSCETIVFLSDEACYDEFVLNTIKNAEALFIAGGNQWDYVRMWKGTPVEEAIHYVAAKPAPVGGTSAGLAILGEFYFSAEHNTIYSDEALEDPYHPRLTLDRDFLDLDLMGGTITDSHFVARDRMGRLVTWLARIVQDGWAATARGIGVNEKTALGVEPNGEVTMFSLCTYGVAYFLETPGLPEVCQPQTPLTYTGLSVYRMSGDATFNLADWFGTGGTWYELSAVEGVLVSDLPDGSIY